MEPEVEIIFIQFQASGNTRSNTVNWDSIDGWGCSCEDYFYRHQKVEHYKCKHIKKAEKMLGVRV